MQDPLPYVHTLLQSALDAYNADQWEPALTLLKIALTNDAGNHEALYLLGHVQFTLKQFPEAEKALRQSLLIDPSQAKAQNDLGATLFAMGRDAEALTHIRQALTLDPDLPEAEESDGAEFRRRHGLPPSVPIIAFLGYDRRAGNHELNT